MAATIMTHCTHGREDPERATLPFIILNLVGGRVMPGVRCLTVLPVG